jgi:hypothetical protein
MGLLNNEIFSKKGLLRDAAQNDVYEWEIKRTYVLDSPYLTKAPQISQIIRQISGKKIQFISNFMNKKFGAPD